MVPSITFVTGNAKKLEEFVAIMGNVTEIQGDPAAVAQHKSREAARLVPAASMLIRVFVAESHSANRRHLSMLQCFKWTSRKWFLKELGDGGLTKLLAAFEDKSGYALCTFSLCSPDSEPILFEGRIQGTIVSPRGPASFGWDAIFEPTGYTQTFAEMKKSTKNSISHRCRALEKLRMHLASMP